MNFKTLEKKLKLNENYDRIENKSGVEEMLRFMGTYPVENLETSPLSFIQKFTKVASNIIGKENLSEFEQSQPSFSYDQLFWINNYIGLGINKILSEEYKKEAFSSRGIKIMLSHFYARNGYIDFKISESPKTKDKIYWFKKSYEDNLIGAKMIKKFDKKSSAIAYLGAAKAAFKLYKLTKDEEFKDKAIEAYSTFSKDVEEIKDPELFELYNLSQCFLKELKGTIKKYGKNLRRVGKVCKRVKRKSERKWEPKNKKRLKRYKRRQKGKAIKEWLEYF